MNRTLLSIALASTLASCDRQPLGPDPHVGVPVGVPVAVPVAVSPDPQVGGYQGGGDAVECCMWLKGHGSYLVSSQVPAVTNVCLGSSTVWSAAIEPGRPLEIPIAKLAAGKPVTLQFFAGKQPQRCLDDGTLAALPQKRDRVEIKFAGGGPVSQRCRTAICTCPHCPDPGMPDPAHRGLDR